MVEFERNARRAKSIPLISLIDVVFQLLIYFMITSTFTRSESLELLLPPAVNAKSPIAKKEDAKTIHIYISDLGETFIEQRSVGEQQMVSELKEMLASNPDNGILVLSASKVSVQVMVRVMDRIYTAGGKNVAVADWVMPKSVEKKTNG